MTAARPRGQPNAVETREIVRLHAAGQPAGAIATTLRHSKGTVLDALHEAGADVRPGRRRVDVDGAAVAKRYRDGQSISNVAAEFGVSRSVVSARMDEQRTPTRQRELQLRIAELVAAYERAESCASIARRLGCSWNAVAERLKRAGVHMRTRSESRRASAGRLCWDETQRVVRVKEPNGEWRRVGRVIWERAHGPVPDDCAVVQIDKELPANRVERLDNLALIERKTLPGRVWAKGRIDPSRSPGNRRDVLIAILLIASLKAGATRMRLGSG